MYYRSTGIYLLVIITPLLFFDPKVQGMGSNSAFEVKQKRCERITIPMCQDMPYNATRMPNLVGHYTQSEAAIKVSNSRPI